MVLHFTAYGVLLTGKEEIFLVFLATPWKWIQNNLNLWTLQCCQPDKWALQQDVTPADVFSQGCGCLPQNKYCEIASTGVPANSCCPSSPACGKYSTPQPRLRHCCGQDFQGFVRVKQSKTASASTSSKAVGIFTSPLSHSLSGHIRRLETARTAPRTLILHSLDEKSKAFSLGW